MTTFPQLIKLLDQQVDDKSRPAASPASPLRVMSEATIMTDFASFTEDLVKRFPKLRKERCEAAEKQASLLKRWTSQLPLEDNLLTQILDHMKEKKEIESDLRDQANCLQEQMLGWKREIEDTENELVSPTHQRVKLTEDRLKNRFKSRCDVVEMMCEDLTQVTVELRQELHKEKRKLRRMEKRLEEEKEKQRCRICMTNNRNAVIMPCMHFLYCSDCLNYYQKKKDNCPTCRGLIAAVLNCKLNIE